MGKIVHICLIVKYKIINEFNDKNILALSQIVLIKVIQWLCSPAWIGNNIFKVIKKAYKTNKEILQKLHKTCKS